MQPPHSSVLSYSKITRAGWKYLSRVSFPNSMLLDSGISESSKSNVFVYEAIKVGLMASRGRESHGAYLEKSLARKAWPGFACRVTLSPFLFSLWVYVLFITFAVEGNGGGLPRGRGRGWKGRFGPSPPCTFISLGWSLSRIRNQPAERSCYAEIKSQTRWVGSVGSTRGERRWKGTRRKKMKRRKRNAEEEDKEEASLVKCTLQGLCITCRLQSSTLLFRLLAWSRVSSSLFFYSKCSPSARLSHGNSTSFLATVLRPRLACPSPTTPG